MGVQTTTRPHADQRESEETNGCGALMMLDCGRDLAVHMKNVRRKPRKTIKLNNEIISNLKGKGGIYDRYLNFKG